MRKILFILLILANLLNAQFLNLMQENNKELNSNSTFSNWNYTNLLSGWNFTSGWSVASTASIINANSFSTTGVGGVRKNSIMTIGNLYFLSMTGTKTSTSNVIVVNYGGTTTYQTISTASFNFSNTPFMATTDGGYYIFNLSAGTTTITSQIIKNAAIPSGFTSATMNATNYVLQDNGCKFVEAIGETYIETSGNVKAGTRKIKVEQDWTQGKLYITNGVTSVALPQSDGFATVTMSFNGSQKLKVICDNNTISILKKLSIK